MVRRIRNPRYAPECLERKLSPSAAVPLPPAQVQALDSPADPPNDPMPDQPSGPVGPAAAYSDPPNDPMPDAPAGPVMPA